MTSLLVTLDGETYEIEIGPQPPASGMLTVVVNGQPVSVEVPDAGPPPAETEWLIIDGRPYELAFDAALQGVRAADGLHTLEIQDRSLGTIRPRSGDGRVKAPIPGLITRVLVEPGQPVTAGQPLVVLEAMKMENEIRAPFDGIVESVLIDAGQTVVRGEVLVVVQ